MNHAPAEPSQGPTTSVTLLERAKSLDNQAWERLGDIYGPLVYRLCRLSGIQPNDAQDVVQDVFRALFRNISRFRRDRPGDSFRAWLLTITRNKIRDHFRRQNKSPRPVGGTDMQARIHQLADLGWESSSDGSHFDDESNVMRRVVKLVQGDFKGKTWQAFWQTAMEDKDPADVARQLGISKWSVYQAKSRVLRRLRAELDGLVPV